MKKKSGKSSFETMDKRLARQAERLISMRVPAEEMKTFENRLLLLGDLPKKKAELSQKLRDECTHALLLEIPRRRIEADPGRPTRVLPPTRFCLMCGRYENATQRRTSTGRLRVRFEGLTAKPLGVVGQNYGAITMGLLSRNRPLADYVKATLAARYRGGESLIEKIMYPNLYG